MKRLVLVGGGHAHLEVLRASSVRRFAGAELVLISSAPEHHYSSMVPGHLQGTYREATLTFDLRAITRAAGARLIRAMVDRIDPAGRWVEYDGVHLACDLVSVDIGAVPAALYAVPGAAEHAATVRPMSRAIALRARLDALLVAPDDTPRAITVVGGGAAGVEVTLAVARRLRESGRPGAVTLIERGPALVPDYAPHVRGRLESLLRSRGVEVLTGRTVAAVNEHVITLDDGQTRAASLVIWLTGAAPGPLLRDSGLLRDEGGFMRVDATLRAVSGAAVWGAGDCIALDGHPGLPKAGVYAVREAPVLAHNLRAAIEGGVARRYTPQPHFLALLNTADGRALLRWHGLTSHSRWAWRLKDVIDRRFMRKYQRLHAPSDDA